MLSSGGYFVSLAPWETSTLTVLSSVLWFPGSSGDLLGDDGLHSVVGACRSLAERIRCGVYVPYTSLHLLHQLVSLSLMFVVFLLGFL
ncbi:uncharacterized protein EV420DRAFT_799522 [Desarmillaria tabescens]|uniref:Uncharacterized protein n=1 Tax=Armillaria tabescens TaxID=1929756 RepID=A0AA39NHS8_ARMTA|nr:uncharacterized protein EV420DRAFT_799522 [Desarmillaria tabescens]KAK0465888.1 hypothetical protein EV420DRAFT_799522 [Desarmillaria tabescens]